MPNDFRRQPIKNLWVEEETVVIALYRGDITFGSMNLQIDISSPNKHGTNEWYNTTSTLNATKVLDTEIEVVGYAQWSRNTSNLQHIPDY